MKSLNNYLKRRKDIVCIVIFLLIVLFGIYKYFGHFSNKQSPETLTKTQQVTNNISPKDTKLPFLDIPVEYFSIKDVQWGSAENANGETIADYTQVVLDNRAVYQSYPTKTITIKHYSTNTKPLKTKSFDEVMQEFYKYNPDGGFKSFVEENYKEFGNISTNYLPGDYIQNVNKFDVDDDGIDEQVVTYNFVGSADAGSYRSDIVKGDKIIFSVQEDNARIVPADTTNGFYVEWRRANDRGGRCCPEGYIRTRVVFKDGRFIPLFEQEVKYLKIGKE